MAYGVTLPGIVEIVFVGKYAEQTTMSMFHYVVPAGTAISDGRAYLGLLNTQVQTVGGLFDKYTSVLPTAWTGLYLQFQWIYPTRYARYIDSSVLGAGGQAEGDGLPSSAAAALTKRSDDVAGRHGHGTLHMPAVPQGYCDVTLSNLVTAGVTAYQTLGTQMCVDLTPPSAPAARPAIYSRGSPGLSGLVETCIPERTIRTMRRRVVGRGI